VVARTKLREERVGNYFAQPKSKLQFTPTGCKVLDLALGGGWAERRIINIVGDKSTGKTLLAIEASANFAIKYPKGKIYYREAEAAFEPDYAAALGMPIHRVDFGDQMETVEDFFEDMERVIAKSKGAPSLYILDSLDALSDRAEMERDIDKGTYGTSKPKQLSEMFRRLVRKMTNANITLIIISQVRSKIGLSFGRKTTRSGGRALDFYSSQVLYLVHVGAIAKTIKGIKRPVGIKIKSKCDKNKVGLPLREAAFSVLFGYGINDRSACLGWLKENKALPKGAEKLKSAKLHELVTKRWYEIEVSFLPTRKKYANGD
jgi:recombination protein RecA